MSPQRRTVISPVHIVIVTSAVMLSLAGILWLNQSSSLSSCGRRIANLQAQRSRLLERRSEALIKFSEATSPEYRERRARALGFAPARELEYVGLPPSTFVTTGPASLDVTGPLRIVHGDDIANEHQVRAPSRDSEPGLTFSAARDSHAEALAPRTDTVQGGSP
jgi:hypothetical protein